MTNIDLAHAMDILCPGAAYHRWDTYEELVMAFNDVSRGAKAHNDELGYTMPTLKQLEDAVALVKVNPPIVLKTDTIQLEIQDLYDGKASKEDSDKKLALLLSKMLNVKIKT